MTDTRPRSGLPVEFLRVLAERSDADTPPVRIAAENVQQLPDGSARDGLILALLRGALSASAPQWLIQAAIDSGLAKEDAHFYAGAPLDLAATALCHPSCSDDQRDAALTRCSTEQLGALGREEHGAVLAEAVVAELGRRGPHALPMTPQLREQPGAAQVILREPALHDIVFHAALDLLPVFPDLTPMKGASGDDLMERHKAYRAARKAWESMWERVVSVHTRRHRQLLNWARDNDADHVIRRHLLNTVPWDVEPSLLEEVAQDDLAGFRLQSLITRACRLMRDGLSPDQARERLATELKSLTDAELRDFETLTEPDTHLREYSLHSAVSWVQYTTEHSWRHILNPLEAKPRFGDPHFWRAPDELLATLGRRFADTALEALDLWEPVKASTRPAPQDLRWLHALLIHHSELTVEARDKARAVLRHLRPQSRPAWQRDDFAAEQSDREFAALWNAIDGILGDPAAPRGNSALGDPSHVTVQRLSAVPDDVLDDYLSRHAGDDTLVEKALLSFTTRVSHRQGLSFADVLKRHSAPQQVLLELTTHLRQCLGGGPHLREAWTREILTLPNCTDELIRALPAWAALTVASPRHGSPHSAVTSLVTAALADDEAAWTRLAHSPASHSGPTAWLRLGDILHASVSGTPWPKPPTTARSTAAAEC